MVAKGFKRIKNKRGECPVCSRKFVGDANQIYCEKKCARVQERRINKLTGRRRREQRVIKCKICSNEFKPYGGGIYCSKECSKQGKCNGCLRQRMKVFEHYGGTPPKCKNCGFYDIRALQLDHINNDGAKERRSTYGSNQKTVRKLIVEGFPKGYQILCANCNWIKEIEHRQNKKAEMLVAGE